MHQNNKAAIESGLTFIKECIDMMNLEDRVGSVATYSAHLDSMSVADLVARQMELISVMSAVELIHGALIAQTLKLDPSLDSIGRIAERLTKNQL